MKYRPIDQVEQSDRLGRNIYANDGRVLLGKGISLTIGLIGRLKRMGVHAVYVMDDEEEGKDIPDSEDESSISDKTKREVMKNLSESLGIIQEGKDFHTKDLGQTTKNIIDELLHNKDVLLQLEDIRTKDNELLIHSMHVTVMSVLVGIKLEYTNKELIELGIGAILHDVGKVGSEQKDGLATNEHHAWIGFNTLRQNREISTVSAHVAFQHHEYLDGSGEPRGVEGKNIHPYARIVSVANTYDNLVSPQDGSQPLLPYEAGEQIMGLAGEKFDRDVVWQFLRSVAFYPNGSNVHLSNGSIATIVGQNKGLPQRPIVRIFSNNTTNQYMHYDVEEINLAKAPTLFINRMVQD